VAAVSEPSDRGSHEDSDELPEELDVTAYVGPYLFPNITRRRLAGALYVTLAAVCVVGWIVTANEGALAAAVLLVAVAAYHFLAGWDVKVDQTQALLIATRTVGFPVGHASAQLAWRGLRSRPAWRILLYSGDEPPTRRGLVELDAVDGHVLGDYTEPNPEDWSQYGLG
jgi:hypothetical protein